MEVQGGEEAAATERRIVPNAVGQDEHKRHARHGIRQRSSRYSSLLRVNPVQIFKEQRLVGAGSHLASVNARSASKDLLDVGLRGPGQQWLDRPGSTEREVSGYRGGGASSPPRRRMRCSILAIISGLPSNPRCESFHGVDQSGGRSGID